LPEIICNTSPLQYLHQLDALRVFPQLVKTITIPPAVKQELEVGRALGLALPEVENLSWVVVRIPSSAVALPLVTDLGAGEREVLALALETPDSVCVLDDALARQVARALHIRVTGTLGILIDAKRAGIISAVRPLIDQLQSLGFRLAPRTRAAVLTITEETD
jgi:predicted nucleic acid-binding protein